MTSNLTIGEIVLLNNLMYCEQLGGPDGTFASAVWNGKTVGDYINSVLFNASKIKDDHEYSSGVTGAEYKEILWAIRPNEHLKSLIVRDSHREDISAGESRSAYLFDPSCNEAVIVFKGTQGDAEWIDNVSGLYQVPTAFQENALKWFQSLDLSDCQCITVTGHSKGGNKSKFITIMDDRVDNCYSFDGQGFSDEFIEKYASNIIKNQGKILNIIAQSDFVNILLNDVGKRQFYLGTNFGRMGFAENHCANAILFYDDFGGMSVWKADSQDPKMADLDIMLNSFIRSTKMSTREGVAKMLGAVIVCAEHGDTNGLINIFSDEQHSDSAAKLVAYILRYKQEKPKMVQSVREILKQNGFNTGILGLINFVTNYDLLMELIGKQPSAVISLLKMNHVNDSVVTFLNKHMELFDFLVHTAKYMRKVDPNKYSGEDLKAEDVGTFIGRRKKVFISRRMLIRIAIIAAIIALIILCVVIF
jgi:hypothetical protein